MNTLKWIALLGLSAAWLAGCGNASDTGGAASSTAAVRCIRNADCGSGFECSVEDSGPVCKPHEQTNETLACATDADCGSGLECEFEHGASFCKPHGGGEGGHDGDDRSGPGAGAASNEGHDSDDGAAGVSDEGHGSDDGAAGVSDEGHGSDDGSEDVHDDSGAGGASGEHEGADRDRSEHNEGHG